jgi:alpha-glucosidase
VPEQWYLHLFAPEQPDLKWSNPEVRAEFEDILRFWFDRGVDGFRIDVAHGLMKHPGLPSLGLSMEELLAAPPADHPAWDRPEVHEIYRGWRKIADSYADPRVFVAEAWVHTGSDRLAAYLRPDELHQAFNFDFLRCYWDAEQLRASIEHSLSTLADVGAPTSWVLSNHDIYRHVTRFGRPPTPGLITDRAVYERMPTDLALGTRRARAAALLMLGLPGSAYVYQGEELGLPDVTDLPDDVLQDPIWERSGHTVRGRDGCRVPLPWSGAEPPFGFGTGTPWLPQPAGWKALTVSAQSESTDSTLSLYRDALRIRHEELAPLPETLAWNADAPESVLSFDRGDAVRVVVNLGTEPVALPHHTAVLLGSGPLPHDTLPPDTAAWLRLR